MPLGFVARRFHNGFSTNFILNSYKVLTFYFSQLFEIPFYVALDHKMKSVVVAIRGSLSLEVGFVHYIQL